MNTPSKLARIGAIICGLAIVMGAFGAHAIKSRFPANMVDVFKTGAQYQMYAGLFFLAAAALLPLCKKSLLSKAVKSMFFGTILFSGSLYLLVLTEIKILGAVTPIGGAFTIAAWILLAFSFGDKQDD
jgi:uncharacterized membrane protein YgdD (TMEM256/DUF423 family)